jgi:Heat induced stress protein YflT domain
MEYEDDVSSLEQTGLTQPRHDRDGVGSPHEVILVREVVGLYSTHTGAEAAVKDLQQSHFDMTQLSIVGRGYHTQERSRGQSPTSAVGSWRFATEPTRPETLPIDARQVDAAHDPR